MGFTGEMEKLKIIIKVVLICLFLLGCGSVPVDHSRDLVIRLRNDATTRVILYKICAGQQYRVGEIESLSSGVFRTSHCNSQLRFGIRIFSSDERYATDVLYPLEGQQVDLSYYFHLLLETYVGPRR